MGPIHDDDRRESAAPPAPQPAPPQRSRWWPLRWPFGRGGDDAATRVDPQKAAQFAAESGQAQGVEPDAAGAPKAPVDRAAAVASLNRIMNGERVGVDDDRVMLAELAGKDAATLDVMRAAFAQRRPGESFDAWLRARQSGVSPEAARELEAHLAGDKAQAAAAQLANCAGQPDKLLRVLGSLKTDEERQRAFAAFRAQNPDVSLEGHVEEMARSTPGVGDLFKAVVRKGVVSGMQLMTRDADADADQAKALLRGDAMRAKAIEARRGAPTEAEDRAKALCGVLRTLKTAEERTRFKIAWAADRGCPGLDAAAAEAFFDERAVEGTEGATRDLVTALGSGRAAEAAAADFELARTDSDVAGMMSALATPIDRSLPPEEQQRLLAEHQEKMRRVAEIHTAKYGAGKERKTDGAEPPLDAMQEFRKVIDDAGGGAAGAHTAALNAVVDEGQLGRRDLVSYAHVTKNPELLRAALANLDLETIALVCRDLRPDIDTIVDEITASKPELRTALKIDLRHGSRPASDEGRVARALALYDSKRRRNPFKEGNLDDFTQLGNRPLLGRVTEAASAHTGPMDALRGEILQLRQKLVGGGSLTDAERQRLESACLQMDGVVEGFEQDQKTIDSTVQAAVGAAASAASLGLAPVAGGAAVAKVGGALVGKVGQAVASNLVSGTPVTHKAQAAADSALSGGVGVLLKEVGADPVTSAVVTQAGAMVSKLAGDPDAGLARIAQESAGVAGAGVAPTLEALGAPGAKVAGALASSVAKQAAAGKSPSLETTVTEAGGKVARDALSGVVKDALGEHEGTAVDHGASGKPEPHADPAASAGAGASGAADIALTATGIRPPPSPTRLPIAAAPRAAAPAEEPPPPELEYVEAAAAAPQSSPPPTTGVRVDPAPPELEYVDLDEELALELAQRTRR